MKNKVFSVAFIAVMFGMSNIASAYEIKGKVAGVKKGVVILKVSEPSALAFADTAKISGGKFTFKGEIKDAVHAMITICPEGQESAVMGLILEDAPISISQNWADVKEQYGRRGFIKSNYTGGVNYDLSKRHSSVYPNILAKPENAAYKKAMDEMQPLYESRDDAAIAKIEEIKKRVANDAERIQNESHEATIKLINENRDTEYAAYILNTISNRLTLSELEAIFNNLTPKVQKAYYAQSVKEEIAAQKSVAPGQVAPDFTLKAFDGSKFTLSSLRGKYVVVDFWASWCAPCRAAVPELKEMYAKYKAKGFEMVGVTNDSREKDWIKAVNDDQTPWIHVIDEFPIERKPAKVATLYAIPFLPTYFLIAPDGKIVGRLDKSELKAKLKEIYGE